MRNARIRLFIRRRCGGEPYGRAILAEAVLFEAAAEIISERYDQYCQAATGTLLDFLDWVLANADEIIAILKMLLNWS